MDMRAFMDGLIDVPVLFFLFAAGAFLLLTLLLALIAYYVACAVNKTTRMTGLVTVGLTLNDWPDDTNRSQCPKMSCGEYLVSMQDPASIVKNRLDPSLTWLQKAVCRRYEVQLLLRRFCAEFEAAGFRQDPAAGLLNALLKDDKFYDRLGTISRRNAGKGIQYQGEAVCKKNGANVDKVSIYLDIPQEKDAADYLTLTHCAAKNICITLEYHA